MVPPPLKGKWTLSATQSHLSLILPTANSDEDLEQNQYYMTLDSPQVEFRPQSPVCLTIALNHPLS